MTKRKLVGFLMQKFNYQQIKILRKFNQLVTHTKNRRINHIWICELPHDIQCSTESLDVDTKGMQDVLSLSKNKNKRIKVTTLLKIASNDLLINKFQHSSHLHHIFRNTRTWKLFSAIKCFHGDSTTCSGLFLSLH